MVHWIWILVVFFGGGFLGMVIISIFAASQISELKLWNRRLQKERDDAVRQRDEVVKINHELINKEQ